MRSFGAVYESVVDTDSSTLNDALETLLQGESGALEDLMEVMKSLFLANENTRSILVASRFVDLIGSPGKGFEEYEALRQTIQDAGIYEGRFDASGTVTPDVRSLYIRLKVDGKYKNIDIKDAPVATAVGELLKNNPNVYDRYVALANSVDALEQGYLSRTPDGKKASRAIAKALRGQKAVRKSIQQVQASRMVQPYLDFLADKGIRVDPELFVRRTAKTDAAFKLDPLAPTESYLGGQLDLLREFWSDATARINGETEVNRFLDDVVVDWNEIGKGRSKGLHVSSVRVNAVADEKLEKVERTRGIRVLFERLDVAEEMALEGDPIQVPVTDPAEGEGAMRVYTVQAVREMRRALNAMVFVSPLVNDGMRPTPTSVVRHVLPETYDGVAKFTQSLVEASKRDRAIETILLREANVNREVIQQLSLPENYQDLGGSLPFSITDRGQITSRGARDIAKMRARAIKHVRLAVAAELVSKGILEQVSDLTAPKTTLKGKGSKTLEVVKVDGKPTDRLSIRPNAAFMFSIGNQDVGSRSLYEYIEATGADKAYQIWRDVMQKGINAFNQEVSRSFGNGYATLEWHLKRGDDFITPTVHWNTPLVVKGRSSDGFKNKGGARVYQVETIGLRVAGEKGDVTFTPYGERVIGARTMSREQTFERGGGAGLSTGVLHTALDGTNMTGATVVYRLSELSAYPKLAAHVLPGNPVKKIVDRAFDEKSTMIAAAKEKSAKNMAKVIEVAFRGRMSNAGKSPAEVDKLWAESELNPDSENYEGGIEKINAAVSGEEAEGSVDQIEETTSDAAVDYEADPDLEVTEDEFADEEKNWEGPDAAETIAMMKSMLAEDNPDITDAEVVEAMKTMARRRRAKKKSQDFREC